LFEHFKVTLTDFWKMTPGDFWFMNDTLLWVLKQKKGANDEMTQEDFSDVMQFDKRMK